MTTYLRDGSADNADSAFVESNLFGFSEEDLLPGVKPSQDDPNALAGNGTYPFKYLKLEAIQRWHLEKLGDPDELRELFAELYARQSEV